MKHIPKQSY